MNSKGENGENTSYRAPGMVDEQGGFRLLTLVGWAWAGLGWVWDVHGRLVAWFSRRLA
jgi:hypothetical protein